jgi:opacity protein-like surface antigen
MAISLPKFSRSIILVAASGLAASAAGPHLGLQALVTEPTGSMRSQFTDRTGYGVGVFADWDVSYQSSLRVGYDAAFYPGAQDNLLIPGLAATRASSDRKFSSGTLSFQFLQFPGLRGEGFYWMLGAGATKQNEKTNSTATLGNNTVAALSTSHDTGTRLALMAGLGYEYNRNWGVFARYTFSTVDAHTIGALQGGLSYRF